MTDRKRLVQQVGLALRELVPRLSSLNDVVGHAVDLRGIDLAILDHLGRAGPSSPSDLGEHFHIHPATMTGILDRLEKGGWLTRQRADDDRRKVILQALRNRGPELVRLYAPMNTAIADICSDLSDAELETVIQFLRMVAAAADTATATVVATE